MKRLGVFLIVLLAILTTCSAKADDTMIKYGANIYKPGEPLGTTKAIFVARQFKIGKGPMIWQAEGGGWFDNTGMDGRHSSGLVGVSIGINVNAGVFYGQALVGPSLITNPDSVLGGPFQINNDVGIGIQDQVTLARLGFHYKHDSSAGLEKPNEGRDFYLFGVTFPW